METTKKYQLIDLFDEDSLKLYMKEQLELGVIIYKYFSLFGSPFRLIYDKTNDKFEWKEIAPESNRYIDNKIYYCSHDDLNMGVCTQMNGEFDVGEETVIITYIEGASVTRFPKLSGLYHRMHGPKPCVPRNL